MSKFTEKYTQADTTAIMLEDVTFNVRLPTSANRRYERAIAAKATRRNADTGQFEIVDMDVAQLYDAQYRAFLSACVVSVDGFDFDPETFADEYPDAVEDLYGKAIALAQDAESEAADEVGKSQSSSPGRRNGKGEPSSIEDLKQAAG